MGRSLGSGVAVHLSAKRNVDKLILVTPFDSILNVAKNIYWMFPISMLLKDKYESWQKVADIDADSLLLVAEYDQVVPKIHGINLANYFKRRQPKVLIIKNASHNTIEQYEQYQQAIKLFTQ